MSLQKICLHFLNVLTLECLYHSILYRDFYASLTAMPFYGMFQNAYQITEKSEELKRMMLVKSGSLVRPGERKYWERLLRSVPRMGVRLGGFNRVEREAVPIFIDFSVCQIVDILIAFQ